MRIFGFLGGCLAATLAVADSESLAIEPGTLFFGDWAYQIETPPNKIELLIGLPVLLEITGIGSLASRVELPPGFCYVSGTVAMSQFHPGTDTYYVGVQSVAFHCDGAHIVSGSVEGLFAAQTDEGGLDLSLPLKLTDTPAGARLHFPNSVAVVATRKTAFRVQEPLLVAQEP